MKIEIDTNEFMYGNSEVEIQSIINLLTNLKKDIKKDREEQEKARKESRSTKKSKKVSNDSIVISAPKGDVEE